MIHLKDLSFRQLLCFHEVVRRGSVTAAAEALEITQPTVSAHIRTLEQTFDAPLLERRGRGVAPTVLGEQVARHAQSVFDAAQEMLHSVSAGGEYAAPIRVGVDHAIPQDLAIDILGRLHTTSQHLHVDSGRASELLSRLAVHALDVVLTDTPTAEPLHHVRAFNHHLGDSPIAFVAPEPAPQLLPALCAVPVVLPGPDAVLRRALDDWSEANDVDWPVEATFDDAELRTRFAERFGCVLPVCAASADRVATHLGWHRIGTVEDVVQRFYAITTERRIRNPALAALADPTVAEVFERRTGRP
jgi:LysR family transcriptional activator of nhaA